MRDLLVVFFLIEKLNNQRTKNHENVEQHIQISNMDNLFTQKYAIRYNDNKLYVKDKNDFVIISCNRIKCH